MRVGGVYLVPLRMLKSRLETMKIELTLGIVKSLRLDENPTGLNAKKTLITETNVGRARYILWDAHQKAPPGVGVRVSEKKTYILRRKVHGKSTMTTVGNVAERPAPPPV